MKWCLNLGIKASVACEMRHKGHLILVEVKSNESQVENRTNLIEYLAISESISTKSTFLLEKLQTCLRNPLI